MFVLVSADSGSRATVEDAGNLKQLQIEFRGVSDHTGAEAVAVSGLGTAEAEHGWLDVAALRAAGEDSVRSAGGDTADWGRQFDAMIAYAASKGWTDPDGTRVRAHIVRS